MRQIIGIALLAAWLAAPARVAAQPGDDEAKKRAAELHEEGREHYRAGDYDAAIAAFGEAYRISDLPGILFNIAQAHRLRGDCGAAGRYYRRFVEAAPDAANRPAAQEHLEAMDECAADEPGGDADRETPSAGDPEPSGGEPAEVVSDLGSSGAGGGTARAVGIGAGAAGVVAIGAGALAGLSARGARSDYVAHLQGAGGEFDAEAQRLEGRFYRRRRWSVGLVAGGATLAVAGGALYVWARGGGGERAVAVAPHGDGAVVVLSGRY